MQLLGTGLVEPSSSKEVRRRQMPCGAVTVTAGGMCDPRPVSQAAA